MSVKLFVCVCNGPRRTEPAVSCCQAVTVAGASPGVSEVRFLFRLIVESAMEAARERERAPITKKKKT